MIISLFFILLTTVVICNSAQRGGSSVALLEITGGKGIVQVNGKTYRKNARLILSGGDEVVFGSSGKHAYVSFRYGSLGRIVLLFFWFLFFSSFLACVCWSPLQRNQLVMCSIYLHYKLLRVFHS